MREHYIIQPPLELEVTLHGRLGSCSLSVIACMFCSISPRNLAVRLDLDTSSYGLVSLCATSTWGLKIRFSASTGRNWLQVSEVNPSYVEVICSKFQQRPLRHSSVFNEKPRNSRWHLSVCPSIYSPEMCWHSYLKGFTFSCVSME